MPFICRDCDNKNDFKQVRNCVCYYSEEEYIDRNGDNCDYGDRYNEDDECNDVEDVHCNDCDSGNVEDVTEEEWNNWEGPDEEPLTWQERYTG